MWYQVFGFLIPHTILVFCYWGKVCKVKQTQARKLSIQHLKLAYEHPLGLMDYRYWSNSADPCWLGCSSDLPKVDDDNNNNDIYKKILTSTFGIDNNRNILNIYLLYLKSIIKYFYNPFTWNDGVFLCEWKYLEDLHSLKHTMFT